MNHVFYAILIFLLLVFIKGSSAQERPFGVGVVIGEPTGLSAKLWVSQTTAFDFGLGWSFGGDRGGSFDYDGESRVHFHMDYLWHWFDAIRSSERFPLYSGIGGRINSRVGKSSVAARGVFGIAWLPNEVPIDIFIEFVPSLQVIPSTGFGIDAGLGARYFF